MQCVERKPWEESESETTYWDEKAKDDENYLGDDVFKVEEVRGRRRNRDDEVEYLIKWEGYASDENTWEPAENVSKDLIAEWRERKRAKEAGEYAAAEARRAAKVLKKNTGDVETDDSAGADTSATTGQGSSSHKVLRKGAPDAKKKAAALKGYQDARARSATIKYQGDKEDDAAKEAQRKALEQAAKERAERERVWRQKVDADRAAWREKSEREKAARERARARSEQESDPYVPPSKRGLGRARKEEQHGARDLKQAARMRKNQRHGREEDSDESSDDEVALGKMKRRLTKHGDAHGKRPRGRPTKEETEVRAAAAAATSGGNGTPKPPAGLTALGRPSSANARTGVTSSGGTGKMTVAMAARAERMAAMASATPSSGNGSSVLKGSRAGVSSGRAPVDADSVAFPVKSDTSAPGSEDEFGDWGDNAGSDGSDASPSDPEEDLEEDIDGIRCGGRATAAAASFAPRRTTSNGAAKGGGKTYSSGCEAGKAAARSPKSKSGTGGGSSTGAGGGGYRIRRKTASELAIERNVAESSSNSPARHLEMHAAAFPNLALPSAYSSTASVPPQTASSPASATSPASALPSFESTPLTAAAASLGNSHLTAAPAPRVPRVHSEFYNLMPVSSATAPPRPPVPRQPPISQLPPPPSAVAPSVDFDAVRGLLAKAAAGCCGSANSSVSTAAHEKGPPSVPYASEMSRVGKGFRGVGGQVRGRGRFGSPSAWTPVGRRPEMPNASDLLASASALMPSSYQKNPTVPPPQMALSQPGIQPLGLPMGPAHTQQQAFQFQPPQDPRQRQAPDQPSAPQTSSTTASEPRCAAGAIVRDPRCSADPRRGGGPGTDAQINGGNTCGPMSTSAGPVLSRAAGAHGFVQGTGLLSGGPGSGPGGGTRGGGGLGFYGGSPSDATGLVVGTPVSGGHGGGGLGGHQGASPLFGGGMCGAGGMSSGMCGLSTGMPGMLGTGMGPGIGSGVCGGTIGAELGGSVGAGMGGGVGSGCGCGGMGNMAGCGFMGGSQGASGPNCRASNGGGYGCDGGAPLCGGAPLGRAGGVGASLGHSSAFGGSCGGCGFLGGGTPSGFGGPGFCHDARNVCGASNLMGSSAADRTDARPAIASGGPGMSAGGSSAQATQQELLDQLMHVFDAGRTAS